MTPKAIRLPPADRLYDPAKDAARLLGWFGLAILMVGAPLVGVLSRRALFILLPIGAAILASAYFLSLSNAGLKALRQALVSPVGLAGLFLAGWSAVSIVWTPFPEIAAPRVLATLATVLVAAVVIAHLPERRARPALFLLPGGVAVTALATLGLALLGPASFRGGTEFDPSLLERSMLTLVVLVWPAVGALSVFERWRLAMGLAAVVAATLTAAHAPIAMAVFMLGALTFVAAAGQPRRTAACAAVLLAVLVVLAPLLPFGLAPLAEAIPMVGHSTVQAMDDWRDLVVGDAARLITGHGLDAARHGVVIGFLPGHTPRSILFEAWYDLGALGALALAAAFGLGLIAAGDAAPFVAPALLAGLVATLAIAVFGVATAELWFITLASLQAIAFGLLGRASRSIRPSATAGRQAGDE